VVEEIALFCRVGFAANGQPASPETFQKAGFSQAGLLKHRYFEKNEEYFGSSNQN
jgi:hypothetical protein